MQKIRIVALTVQKFVSGGKNYPPPPPIRLAYIKKPIQNRVNTFPDTWKIGNIVPVHKKESKQLVKNYRPISLLPICGKIFEKVIYNALFDYLKTNELLVNC